MKKNKNLKKVQIQKKYKNKNPKQMVNKATQSKHYKKNYQHKNQLKSKKNKKMFQTEAIINNKKNIRKKLRILKAVLATVIDLTKFWVFIRF